MDGWYIKACPNPNCDIKVDEVEDGHFCGNSKASVRDPLHKYKIKCDFKDNDKDSTVVLNDDDCYRIIGKSASELLAVMHQNVRVHEAPKNVMDFVGRSFLFRVGGYTKDEENVRTYNIDSVYDGPNTVAVNKLTKDESSDEDLDSDEDLNLMLQNTTEVDSNEPPKVDEESMITPCSKRHRTEDSSDSDAAPTTQGSTSMKLKAVKVEEP